MSNLDMAALEIESQSLAKKNGNNDYLENFVKFPDGNGFVVVRILPPAEAGMFNRQKSPLYQGTRIHRVNNKSLHCLKVKDGKRWAGDCPICQYYNWLYQEADKNPADANRLRAMAKSIKPIERYYYNVIVRKVVDDNGNVHENVGPKILSVGQTLHSMIVTYIMGNKEMQIEGLGNITHTATGRDFKIVKTMRASGDETFPNYDKSLILDPSPLGSPDQIKLWMSSLFDLEALRAIKPAEDMKLELKRHLGLIPDEKSNFDPSEYQAGSVVQAGHRSEAVVSQSVVSTATNTQPALNEVENAVSGLEDDEFLDMLRK